VAAGTKRKAGDHDSLAYKKWKGIESGACSEPLPSLPDIDAGTHERQMLNVAGETSLNTTRYDLVAVANSDVVVLQIRKPDGRDIDIPLSERCKQWSFLQDFLNERDEEVAMPLCFPSWLNDIGERLLIRYIGEARDPVDSFPLLTLQELHQFAGIETYLGGDHPHFWQLYGFQDGNMAVMLLTEAFGKRQMDIVQGSNATLPDILATGIDFATTKSVAELRMLRFSVLPELIPFVYAALRDHLGNIATEREEIGNRARPNDRQRKTHLYWLYQVVKARLTPDLMCAERMAMLRPNGNFSAQAFEELYLACTSQFGDDWVAVERNAVFELKISSVRKIKILSALYLGYASKFTAEKIRSERGAILASALKHEEKMPVLVALYQYGASKFTAAEIKSERDLILVSALGVSEKIQLLVALYHGGGATFTASDIQSERSRILALEPYLQERLLPALYRGAASKFTAEEIRSERSIIMALGNPRKTKFLSALYQGGASKFTTVEFRSERNFVMTLNVGVYYKKDILSGLYQGGASNFTAEEMVDERSAILDFQMEDVDDTYKSVLLKAMYLARFRQLSVAQLIAARVAIVSSNMRNRDKIPLMKVLYGIGTGYFTIEEMRAERRDILNSRQGRSAEGDKWKGLSLSFLYEACANKLTREDIIGEMAAIRGSTLAYYAQARALAGIYFAGAAQFTAEMVREELVQIIDSTMSDEYKSETLKFLCDLSKQVTAEMLCDLCREDGARLRVLGGLCRPGVGHQNPFMPLVLCQLYAVVSETLTAAIVAAERESVLASDMDDGSKSTVLIALYQAAAGRLTENDIALERETFMGFRMLNGPKFVVTQVLDQLPRRA
jgi:hypothetical protein